MWKFAAQAKEWTQSKIVRGLDSAANSIVWLRPIFHWQYSGIAIPFLWGAGLAMVAIALTLDDPESIHDAFMLAYVALIAGGICSIGYWITSDYINELRTRVRRARKPHKRKETKTRYYSWQYGVISGICLLFICLVYYGHRIETTRRLSTFTGQLYPANDPFESACGNAQGEQDGIILVGTAAYQFSHWPAVLLAVNGKNRIVLDRASNDAVTFTAEIFSTDGKILIDVLKNAFNVNKNNIFRMYRPDDSTIRVFDQNNEEAFYIRYINSKELRFRAKLYYPDYGQVDIFNRFQQICLMHFGANPTMFNVVKPH
jgi:hypothetical protein